MIQVSNEFKKAIKEPERRIKGYVEVLYDLPNVETIPSSTYIQSTYTNIDEITNGVRVENLYGNLDYLPLDGSYLTMSPNRIENVNSGYISDELFKNISTPEFTINLAQTTKLNGITLYFRTNIPTQITLYCVLDGEYDEQIITNDGKDSIQVIFDSPKDVEQIIVYINSVEYTDKKIYINEVDLGITEVYKDQDLIEFTVDEEVNKLVEEVPINETDITLNNMTDLFNPLNPKGIVPYLSENTLIKPYIGVLTENLGVEYVKMGEFYFDSYTNNSDATTTLVGKNLIKQLETRELIDDNETNFFQTILNENDFNNYMNNYDYSISNENWSRNVSAMYWKDRNLIKFLKDVAFYQDNLLYSNRNSEIKIKKQNINPVDILSKNELINDAEFKYIDKINSINIKRPYSASEEDVTSRTILEETIKLKKVSEVHLFSTNSPIMFGAVVSQSGGTSATIISYGIYMVFVKITGNIGDEVSLTFTSTKNRNESNLEYKLEKENENKKVILEFESPLNTWAISPVGYIANSDILNRTPSYEMRFDYNGDPSLEAGDYINVETPYGYKPLFIQKNRFKFDGGLEGSIEGVE